MMTVPRKKAVVGDYTRNGLGHHRFDRLDGGQRRVSADYAWNVSLNGKALGQGKVNPGNLSIPAITGCGEEFAP
ncbi:MAG: hypothetical protein U0401_25115 [Anaerolineae bacterium]